MPPKLSCTAFAELFFQSFCNSLAVLGNHLYVYLFISRFKLSSHAYEFTQTICLCYDAFKILQEIVSYVLYFLVCDNLIFLSFFSLKYF